MTDTQPRVTRVPPGLLHGRPTARWAPSFHCSTESRMSGISKEDRRSKAPARSESFGRAR